MGVPHFTPTTKAFLTNQAQYYHPIWPGHQIKTPLMIGLNITRLKNLIYHTSCSRGLNLFLNSLLFFSSNSGKWTSGTVHFVWSVKCRFIYVWKSIHLMANKRPGQGETLTKYNKYNYYEHNLGCSNCPMKDSQLKINLLKGTCVHSSQLLHQRKIRAVIVMKVLSKECTSTIKESSIFLQPYSPHKCKQHQTRADYF